MERLKKFFDKDFFIFIFFNLFLADSFITLLIFGIMFAIYFIIFSGNNLILGNVNLVILYFSILIFAVIKILSLVYYYKNFYETNVNRSLKKLIEKLKIDKHFFRTKYLLIILCPYLLLGTINCIISFHNWKKFCDDLSTIILCSSLIPYSILFIYWDYLNQKKASQQYRKKCNSLYLKKIWNCINCYYFSYTIFKLLRIS